MGVVTSDANPVCLWVFDRLAGMESGVQLLNHILMAARTLIKPVEVVHSFIDGARVRMKAFFGDIAVAFETRHPPVGGSMETPGIDKP
jgi:hypothetical protein